METEKKQWTKPELIVLVRSKPEEAVLLACKYVGRGGPVSDVSECASKKGYWCYHCVVDAVS
jgi:hypothetical protein